MFTPFSSNPSGLFFSAMNDHPLRAYSTSLASLLELFSSLLEDDATEPLLTASPNAYAVASLNPSFSFSVAMRAVLCMTRACRKRFRQLSTRWLTP
jgi:hypothetical protein